MGGSSAPGRRATPTARNCDAAKNGKNEKPSYCPRSSLSASHSGNCACRMLACAPGMSDGTRRWLSVSATPIRASADRIDGAVVTFVDVTAAKQAAAAWGPVIEAFRRL